MHVVGCWCLLVGRNKYAPRRLCGVREVPGEHGPMAQQIVLHLVDCERAGVMRIKMYFLRFLRCLSSALVTEVVDVHLLFPEPCRSG